MPKFCTNCGNPLVDTAKFCTNCGHRVSPAPNSRSRKPVPQPPKTQPEVPPEVQSDDLSEVRPIFQAEPRPVLQPEPQPAVVPEQPVEQPEPQPADEPEQPVEQPESQPADEPEQPVEQPEPQPADGVEQPKEQSEPRQPSQPEDSSYKSKITAFQRNVSRHGYHAQAAESQPAASDSHQAEEPSAPKGTAKRQQMIAIAAAAGLLILAIFACFIWPGWLRPSKGPATPSTPASSAQPVESSQADALPSTQALVTTEAAVLDNPFTDVTDYDYNYPEYLWCFRNGVIDGGAVDEYAELSRGQVLLLLWRAMGSPAAGGKELPFTDVTGDDECYPALLWAYEKGFASGSGTAYQPDEPATKGQAITLLCAALGGDGTDLRKTFLDVAAKKYYYSAVNWGVEKGIVFRDETFRFYPEDNMCRGEFLCWLARGLEPDLSLYVYLPWSEGFQDYNVEIDVSAQSVGTFLAADKSDAESRYPLTVELQRYETFPEAEGYPVREGYEWRVADFVIGYGEGASEHSFGLNVGLRDYYYTELYNTEMTIKEDGTSTSWVIWNEQPWKVYNNAMDYQSLDDALFRVHYAIQVPVGYDGVCVFFTSSETFNSESHLFLESYSPENYAFFRFD